MRKPVFWAVLAAGMFLGAALPPLAAEDWPQLQGPHRNGSSDETGLMRAWPKDGPKVLWSIEVGEGFGAPAIYGGSVYFLDRTEDTTDILRCLDLETGAEQWRYAYEAKGSVSYNGSRTPPTVGEKHIFCVGVLGHFHCIDRATHQPVWQHNLVTDFGLEVPRWGISQAPSLYEDLVIVAPQAPDAFVAAYKRDTGELVWKSPSLGLLGYSTPNIVTLDGVPQAVAIGACDKERTHRGSVAGISLEDGHILWSYDGFQCKIPITYPVPLPDDRLFITGGYKAGSAMIQVKREDGTFAVKELFKTDACGSQVHPPVFYKNHLYINSNSNEREDGMMCLTLDGTIKWKTDDFWFGTTFERGNLLLADGLIFNLDGKRGDLYLIEPSPDEYKELASVSVLGGRQIWGPMALSRGKLVVRSQSEMKCLDVKNP